MVQLAAQAAASHDFDDKTLRLSLAEIAHRSYEDDTTINQAMDESWKQAIDHAVADGNLTQIK